MSCHPIATAYLKDSTHRQQKDFFFPFAISPPPIIHFFCRSATAIRDTFHSSYYHQSYTSCIHPFPPPIPPSPCHSSPHLPYLPFPHLHLSPASISYQATNQNQNQWWRKLQSVPSRHSTKSCPSLIILPFAPLYSRVTVSESRFPLPRFDFRLSQLLV